jgi:type I restriction enzyme R subunit
VLPERDPHRVWELKSATQGNTHHDAISDLVTYQEDVPRLFITVLFNVAAADFNFRYGGVGAPPEFYKPWRPDDGGDPDNNVKAAVTSLFRKVVVANLLDRYVFYEEAAGDLRSCRGTCRTTRAK